MRTNLCFLSSILVLSLSGCGSDSDPDTTPPVITITPATFSYELIVGDDVPDITVVATDDRDGDISSAVQISGDTINNQERGFYSVHYNVADEAGNNASEVTVTYNFDYPDAPAGSYKLIIDNDVEVTNKEFGLNEAEIIELSLNLGADEFEGQYAEVKLTQLSGPTVDFQSVGQGEGGGNILLYFRDSESGNESRSYFGERLYARMPHIDADSQITLRLDFYEDYSETNIAYSEEIEVSLTDQGEVPESGLYAKEHQVLTTGPLLAFAKEQPNGWGLPAFTQFFGVYKGENESAFSFYKEVIGERNPDPIDQEIADVQLDAVNLEDVDLFEGYSHVTSTSQIIIPFTTVEDYLSPTVPLETAELLDVPSDFCLYFEKHIVTSRGIVRADGELIFANENLCHIGTAHYRKNVIFNSSTRNAEIVSIEENGLVGVTGSIELLPEPSSSLEVVLFNESGLVFRDTQDLSKHTIYPFSSTSNNGNLPSFGEPIEISISRVTDVVTRPSPFGKSLLIANPEDSYVTHLLQLQSGEWLVEKISFDTPISVISKASAEADWFFNSLVLFTGKEANNIFVRKDDLNDWFD